MDHGGAVERGQRDSEEGLQSILDGPWRGRGAANDVDESVDDVTLGPNDMAV